VVLVSDQGGDVAIFINLPDIGSISEENFAIDPNSDS
jgi:hypothetical protein